MKPKYAYCLINENSELSVNIKLSFSMYCRFELKTANFKRREPLQSKSKKEKQILVKDEEHLGFFSGPAIGDRRRLMLDSVAKATSMTGTRILVSTIVSRAKCRTQT